MIGSNFKPSDRKIISMNKFLRWNFNLNTISMFYLVSLEYHFVQTCSMFCQETVITLCVLTNLSSERRKTLQNIDEVLKYDIFNTTTCTTSSPCPFKNTMSKMKWKFLRQTATILKAFKSSVDQWITLRSKVWYCKNFYTGLLCQLQNCTEFWENDKD